MAKLQSAQLKRKDQNQPPRRISPQQLRQLAMQYQKNNQLDEARQLYELWLQTHPDDQRLWVNLGALLRNKQQFEAATACYRRAIALNDQDAGVWSNLGNVLKDLHRYDEACEAHQQALAIQPQNFSHQFNYAITLREGSRFDQALTQLNHCQQQKPDDPKIEWERALVLLYLKRFAEGWQAYEARWHTGDLPDRSETCPQWQGESLAGKRILLHAEQGYGDTILAARFIPWVKAQGAHISFECKPELHRIFSELPVEELIAPGHKQNSYDYRCALMSLPGRYGATETNIPQPVTVTVPEQCEDKFAFINKRFSEKLKVGIVWSGSTTFKDNRNRSVSLSHFIKLAQNPSVQLFSLQKGPGQEEIEALGAGALIMDLSNQLNDFADTAAAVRALDLIVMTDSSVAHLAASLGKPVINLLNHKPYWLYGLEKETTSWYPTMRLIRQQRPAVWESVFARVEELLGGWSIEK